MTVPTLGHRGVVLGVLIWHRWRAHGGQGPRPPILPVLLYQGAEKWDVPVSFAQGYAPPERLAGLHSHLLEFPILADNLTAATDAQLLERATTDVGTLLLLILRHARDEDLMDHLERWRHLWQRVASARTDLMVLAAILAHISDVCPHADEARLLALIPMLASEVHEAMPTIKEKYLSQGRQESLQEWVLAGRRDALLKLMQRRFGTLSLDVTARVAAADLVSLDRWTEQILTAGSIDDVLR